jgi:5-methylcytosine-specific restriction endonuclease McrA
MAARQHKNYAARREALVERMGGLCRECGTCFDLEFDHPNGRDWIANKLGRMQRLREYEKDLAAGNLILLCRSCNARKAAYNTHRILALKRMGLMDYPDGGALEGI